MSDAFSGIRSRYKPVKALSDADGYTSPRAVLKIARRLGVPILRFHRLPHVDPEELYKAQEDEARRIAAGLIDPPRRRGRPRNAA